MSDEGWGRRLVQESDLPQCNESYSRVRATAVKKGFKGNCDKDFNRIATYSELSSMIASSARMCVDQTLKAELAPKEIN